MSGANSIVRDDRMPVVPAEPAGFELPPALAGRYDVRVVDGADGEQRIGLFRPTDRDGPSIEITNDRIVARSEDAETVAALVTIAQHSGWDRIAVDGSPEFRQAVWEAATREGLRVSGYDPSFNEQERVEQARRASKERRERDAQQGAAAPPRIDIVGETHPKAAMTPPEADGRGALRDDDGNALSSGDRKLLLTVSRHIEDRKSLDAPLRPGMDAFDRDVRSERLDHNREAVNTSLERALESPTLAAAFEQVGYGPDRLRSLHMVDESHGEIADAIARVRSGMHRETPHLEASEPQRATSAIADELEDAARTKHSAAGSGTLIDREPTVGERQDRDASARQRESEELAEIFLNGTIDRVSADPRLAGAREAQAAMELHIGEVFGGDAGRMATANLESRQMISDVLRRGFEVSVREPTPVRQVEPIQIRSDMER